MCGVLGVYDPAGGTFPRDRFDQALDRLKGRGPDDTGIWSDESVTLGHRRLAIVDLTAAGHQPMVSSDRRFHIVFNGEIYNHLDLRPQLLPLSGWRGNSDTETLLEAYRKWGAECLQRINGMFAFAIWDSQERELFVARDRMGVKPLYYTQSGGRFAFASRPGALALLQEESGSRFDSLALSVYLELGYVPSPLSFHAGSHKLPPAHYLKFNARGCRIVRYWDYRSIAVNQDWSHRREEDLADELQELINHAVKIRLLSDVPLGAFLSGGVDSALIVAAMKANGVPHPKAFTIGFSETEFDEGAAARRIANHLRVDHVCETLDVNSLLELLPNYIGEFDEPFSDSSAFPTMAVSRLARRHVTVALSGDGADELFGGYHYYPLMDRLRPALRWPAQLRQLAGAALSSAPWHRAKLLAGALQATNDVTLFHYLRGVGKDHHRLVRDDFSASAGSAAMFEAFAKAFSPGLSGAETGMRLDMGFTLPDLYLQKVDVASMAFSLEARCPMTDYRLVEWAMRLPQHFKIRGGETKYLLKKVLLRYLPREQVYQPKRGFSVPLAQWLRGPLREWARDLIHDDALMGRLPLDKSAVRSLLDAQLRGERESHPLLWSVLMLLCFVREYEVNVSRPRVSLRDVA